MSEALLALIRDPAIAFGAAVAAAIAAAIACAAFPITLAALRRRFDSIESAQAETAAYVAADLKRLTNLIVQQRADQIGDTLRRSHPEGAGLPVAVKSERRNDERQFASSLENKSVTLPLRKTVH